MKKNYKVYNNYDNCNLCRKCDVMNSGIRPFSSNTLPKSIANENCGVNINDCNNKTRIIAVGKGPIYSNKKSIVNKDLNIMDDPTFYQVKCNSGKCNQVKYMKDNDPRLINNKTGDRIYLDRPAQVSEVTDVYGEELRNYGKNYRTYQDINSGDITYYVAHQNREQNHFPIYTMETNNIKIIREDPMGGFVPEYKKTRITRSMKHQSPYEEMRVRMGVFERGIDSAMIRRDRSDWSKLWLND